MAFTAFRRSLSVYRAEITRLFAAAALDAFLLIDHMFFLAFSRDRACRAFT